MHSAIQIQSISICCHSLAALHPWHKEGIAETGIEVTQGAFCPIDLPYLAKRSAIPWLVVFSFSLSLLVL